jgi:glycosyltransferase involved in cell wall biosynthesis
MPDSPLVFFDCVTHYGGSNKSTLLLIRALQRLNPVMVLDAYGTCREYLDDLSCQHTPYHIVCPETRYPTIGGGTRARRFINIVRSVPEMAGTIRTLRKTVLDIKPKAIWVNSQKALFILSRAVGDTVPMAMYVRGELRCISRWAKRDWHRLKLIVGNSRKGLEYLDGISGLPPRQVIYNGVDIQDLVSRSEVSEISLPDVNNPLKVVMPATLIPLKNHALAIRGLAQYIQSGGQAVLWICGDIPDAIYQQEANEVLQLPEKLGISEHVHFLGWQQNIPAIVRRANVMTLTSRTEGMPRAVMEAMALGKPVLVTGVGGVPELVRDGIDGIVIAADDTVGFTEGLRRLADDDLRRSMGQSGQVRIADHFSLESQARQFFDVLKIIS